jgi:hypothetical protein
MNNEPVAWMHKEAMSWVSTFIHPEIEFDEWMPLYTHPNEHDLGIAEAIGFEKGYKAAIAKTLTDEEIAKVAKDFYLSEYVPYEFARAILRKAQNGHQS